MVYQMLITVAKAELLEKMRANRDQHREIFAEALEGYSQAAISKLQGELKILRQGKKPREIRIFLDRPEDHTADYDRVIGMLEMHNGDEFTVDERTYAQYVNDEWDWKNNWVHLSSKYSERSRSIYGNDED